jgi:hypothetical protein
MYVSSCLEVKRVYDVCQYIFSDEGEYVLDMHYIFSQRFPSSWDIDGRMSSWLRTLSMHVTKVSLDKVLVRISTMLRLVGTWCILMSPFCKWSCSHLILRSTCLVLEFPGLMLLVHITIVERLSSNMWTPCCGDPMFSLSKYRTTPTQWSCLVHIQGLWCHVVSVCVWTLLL